MLITKCIRFIGMSCAAAILTWPALAVEDEIPSTWPTKTNIAEQSDIFSKEGLAALDAAMAKAVEDEEVYGLATLLVQGGEVIAYETYGVQSLETKKPIAEDTIYRIYSMTKPVTGVAMMMLYEEGKWALDDPVTKYVPEFADLSVYAGEDADGEPVYEVMERAPTMRELMTHTAGFAYGLSGSDLVNSTYRETNILLSPDLDSFIDKLSDIPLLFQPGEYWYYSVAVDIQGYIIEKLSGMSLEAFFKTRIFDPLGMKDTGFYVTEDQYHRLSDVFTYNPELGALVKVSGEGILYESVLFKKDTIGMLSGGGGLVGSIGDYARFCQMFLNEGVFNGHRLLKPETIAFMRTNSLPYDLTSWEDGSGSTATAPGMGFGMGFGLIVDARAANMPHSSGTYFWGGAAGTWFWIDPVKNFYFIGMLQYFGNNDPAEPYNFRRESVRLVYEAIE